MADIRINLKKANRQAENLSSAADELKKEAENLSKAAQNVPKYWEGEAADIFRKKLEEQKDDILKCCREMEDIANDIRTVAARIKAQEEAAKKAAQAL